jgi:hypothetical protein
MKGHVFIVRRGGVEDGPYTADEVLAALEEGDLSPHDWGRLASRPHAQMLSELFDQDGWDEEEPRSPAAASPSGRGEPLPKTTPPSMPSDFSSPQMADVFQEVDDGEVDDEEVDDEEVDDEEVDDGEVDDGEVDDGEVDDGDVEYRAAPSLLGYGWPLVVVGLVLTAGYWLGQFGVKWVTGSLGVAFILVVRLLWHRAAREYVVTAEAVEATVGLVAKSSRRVWLRDLSSIRLHRPWPMRWLGVGTVVFSGGDAHPGGDVIFERVGRVNRLLAVVRERQQRLGRR